MAKLIDGVFNIYELSEEEARDAYVFGPLQTRHIKNVLSQYATDKALVAFDPESANAQLKHIMQGEYLRGAIEALNYILHISEIAQYNIKEAMQTDMQTKTATTTEPKTN